MFFLALTGNHIVSVGAAIDTPGNGDNPGNILRCLPWYPVITDYTGIDLLNKDTYCNPATADGFDLQDTCP